LDVTLQERGPCWLGLLAGHERTVQVLAMQCVLKQSSNILASLGTMLAPALSQTGNSRSSTSPRL
jgi:hypothetical protein